MVHYTDGSLLKTRRTDGGFAVDHISGAGIVVATFECDNLTEMRAALHYGPARW